ncbi:hypothetical protein SEUCBS139899_009565 [Sporothrix eucalyptigena]|uniref:Uncharacterized protein n=1 Tax=Sporothrix eucalyptigena TaxID=1812306 RepID=A0ABP0C6N6_9PEZI
MAPEVFHDRISAATSELSRHGGLYYDDPKLNNIMDLELAYSPKPTRAASTQKFAALAFDDQYKYFLKAKRDEEKYLQPGGFR